MSDKFAVITEQGYPMPGSYGYKPLNEEDNLEENAKKESEKKNEKGE